MKETNKLLARGGQDGTALCWELSCPAPPRYIKVSALFLEIFCWNKN